MKLLLNVKSVALMLEMSTRKVWKMSKDGKMPSPIRVGSRSPRWRDSDLREWVKDGCPYNKGVESDG